MASTYEYNTLTGTIIPDVAIIRNDVEQEFKDTFGQDLIISANTPQGMLITSETLARSSVARNNATLANQINPNIAGGVYLDGIWALTGGARTPSTSTIVPGVLLGGVPLAIVPSGSTAKSSNGDIFESVSSVTLDAFGNGVVDFKSIEEGEIPCVVNTLINIVGGSPGWETVTNPNEAIIGTQTQSDESARFYRQNTLALQGTSIPEAIKSALYAIPGFKSLTFRENDTSSTLVKDGVTLVPHSIYVCADGATDNEVAEVLLAKKSGGCAYNGSTTVNITDPESGQVYPVKFDRPALIPILVRVTIKSTTSSVNDPDLVVKNAILDYANGLLNSEPGFVVGAPVSPFELSGAINVRAPSIFVSKVEISYISPVSYVTTELPIEIFQKATVTSSSISVVNI